jgi:hypothetical protein
LGGCGVVAVGGGCVCPAGGSSTDEADTVG